MSEQASTFTVKEVAARLGLSPGTVYDMIREKRFPVKPLPLSQRKVLFSKESIKRLLEDRA